MQQNTVLITGSSSGIGRATVEYFSKQGWNVAATMRLPETEEKLQELSGVKLFCLDVQDPETIKNAIGEAVDHFGKIDVLVNNAGYAAIGPFENADEIQIFRQFDTNVTGLMRVTKLLIKHFREQDGGVVVNVASVAGRMGFPMFSLYSGTKWAVEGFSESLHYELKKFNIKVKIVEPGPIKTDFYSRSMDLISSKDTDVYKKHTDKLVSRLKIMETHGAKPVTVAKKIYKASSSGSNRLRYTSGGGAGLFLFFNWLFPKRVLTSIIRLAMI